MSYSLLSYHPANTKAIQRVCRIAKRVEFARLSAIMDSQHGSQHMQLLPKNGHSEWVCERHVVAYIPTDIRRTTEKSSPKTKLMMQKG